MSKLHIDLATRPTSQQIHVVVRDDLKRSRFTTFFRVPLTAIHLFWLQLWSILVYLVLAPLNWLVMIFTAEPPDAFRRFFGAFIRFHVHIFSYLGSLANLFPGFVGAPGSYPIDLVVPKVGRQKRALIFFRPIIALPSLLLAVLLSVLLILVMILNWFSALFMARVTPGLRGLAVYILRYQAQTLAYGVLLITDEYPYAGPLRYDIEVGPEFVLSKQLLKEKSAE